MKNIMKYNDILYRVQNNWPKEGVDFIDLSPTIMDAESWMQVSTALKNMILENNGDVDFIVSPDARGFLWGSYVAALLKKPLITVRKKGKLPPEFVMSSTSDTTEYSSIELELPQVDDLSGKLCVFVDDVYATGGTYRACQKLISKNGAFLEGAYVVYDVLLTNDKINSLMTANELLLGGVASEIAPAPQQVMKKVLK